MKQETLIETLNQLQKDEGYKSKPYLCTAGKWTVGYGRNFQDVPFTTQELSVLLGLRTETELKDFYFSDLENRISDIDDILKKNLVNYDILHETVKSVLVQMAYQIGVSGLYKFRKTLQYAREGKFEEMADEMLNSSWAHQTPLRANRHSDKIRSLAKK